MAPPCLRPDICHASAIRCAVEVQASLSSSAGDVKARLDAEYSLPVDFEISEFQLARWFSAEDRKTFDIFVNANGSSIAEDVDGDLVFLAKNEFYLGYTRERSPGITFTSVKDVKKASKGD